MEKYTALESHFGSLRQDSWKASFSEIEKIIGSSLPPSARSHREWWANDREHSQARHWMKVGWNTKDVNLDHETVVFCRQGIPIPPLKPILTKSSPLNDAFYTWDAQRKVSMAIKMEWRPVGKLIEDQHGRLLFPKAEQVPAIYRFRIRYADKEAIYIGETDNLKRRFGNYRNPGPSQKTSLRINALLIDALKKKAHISISAIMAQIQIERGKETETATLSSKVIRCMIENIAILDDSAINIEMLNKAKV